MQKSPAGSRTLSLPLFPIQARYRNQQPAGGNRKNSCESTKARRLSNERLSCASTATTRTRTKTVGSKNVIRWHCAWRGTRGSIGAYTMAHCLSSGWHRSALRTRGFCQIMPMLTRSLTLALSLLFPVLERRARMYPSTRRTHPERKRKGKEEKRETRGHLTNVRRMRGENNIARFPHTERLRPTRGDCGPHDDPHAPWRRRVAKVFGGVFHEWESVVISARLDSRSQGVDAVGPLLARGGQVNRGLGAGSQVRPCPVTRCGTLSTGGCPARETSRGAYEMGVRRRCPCVAVAQPGSVRIRNLLSFCRSNWLFRWVLKGKSRDVNDNTTLPKYRYFCCLGIFIQPPVVFTVDTSKILAISYSLS